MSDLLSELEAVAGLSGQAQREAPGELLLADSCSWRRILTVTGGPYIVPTNDRSDGHPNLDCGPDWVCAKEAVAAVNFFRAHHAEIAAAVRDADRLRRACELLPTKVETEHLGDYGPDELAAFDSGYNMALDLAHNLLSRKPGAVAAMSQEGEG